MTARILFVPSPNIYRQRFAPYIPYGLLSLQAVGADFASVVDILKPDKSILAREYRDSVQLCEDLFAAVDVRSYDVVGFSTVCNSFYHTLLFARFAKARNPRIKVVFGGPYVTKLADRVLACFDVVDAIFVGEAECSFADFLTRCDTGKIAFDGIQGVVTREWHGGPGRVVADLDELPAVQDFRDYKDWFDLCIATDAADRSIPLEASRGCPLQCSFCSTKQVWGAKVRRKSAERLHGEMEFLSNLADRSFFNLIGDNLGVPRAHFLAFCNAFAAVNHRSFEWGCSLKMDRLSPEHLDHMWDAGMRAMFVGIESGNQKTLDYVRKKTDVAREIANVRAAIERGFRVDTSFIIGFPWETHTDILDTYSLHCALLKAGANRSQIGILCPIPGTEIVAEGVVKFDLWSSYIAEDDIPPNEELQMLVGRYSDLFAHLGHYVTPAVERSDIKAVRDAAARMTALHQRYRSRASCEWNTF